VTWRIVPGDCIEVMAAMGEASVDAVVCDPPYGLGFMGRAWDDLPPGREWADVCLRVLKPGGHLLAFGGTRTSHRLVCAIEDAGFEIRDTIAWMYGSGFPKSLNLPNGWGTALKPAHEPIVVARKPLAGTVAANVLAYGTGALNVDGCRIEGAPRTTHADGDHRQHMTSKGARGGAWGNPEHDMGASDLVYQAREGRWPANVVMDPDAAAILDEQTGDLGRSAGTQTPGNGAYGTGTTYGAGEGFTDRGIVGFGDSGGASRFFYVAKASSAERNAGLDGFEAIERANGNKWTDQDYRVARGERTEGRESGPRRNVHPTVKPIDLMRWLVRLVTPPGGLVLDPFTGSGTTGTAAVLEGFRFVGIEREPEYAAIARARIAWWAQHPDGMQLVDRLEAERERKAVADAGQLGLFGEVA
jgi:site-specific DNA-methyltransferase (adenine-specific)